VIIKLRALLQQLLASPAAVWLRRRWPVVMFAGLILWLLGAWGWAESCGLRGCPGIEDLRAFRPSEGGTVLDRQGVVLGHLVPVRRINVPLSKVPRHVRAAFIAVEDRRFFEHGAVDWRGGVRAFWANLSHLDVREGSSTLTMQAARSAFLLDYEGERSVRRKLIELALARRMERALTKPQILELYLNVIYLGDATYGVEAASRHYFGKSVADLSLAEGATLAALPRAPSVYEPRRHADRAIERRNLVLAMMARDGFIDSADAEQASLEPLEVSERGWRPAVSASAAIDVVRAFVDSTLGPDAVQGGDIVIWTSFDARAQHAAEQAVRDRAAAIARGGDGEAVQGAMVAMDPSDGELRAIVGGTAAGPGSYNRAIAARRQPGSAFKPFVYAAALEAGLTPATLVDDAPIEIQDEGGEMWRPANFGDAYEGTVTLRHALAHSANAATVRVSQRVGPHRVMDVARRAGVSSPLRAVPSIALGSFEVTPLELVAAYAPFANGGLKVQPTFVRRITAAGDKVLWRAARRAPSRALDPRDAFLVTSMLESAVDEGTGRAVRDLGVAGPVAGKTGTTNDGADVWFVGYTPTLLAGFWFGADTPRPLGGAASGGRMAAPAWASFYRRGWRDDDGRGWRAPAGVVRRVIDDENGLLANEWCPTQRAEWFKAGSEPREYCADHGEPFDQAVERAGRAVVRVMGNAVRHWLGRD
jgi:penicillin-binding protein 1A